MPEIGSSFTEYAARSSLRRSMRWHVSLNASLVEQLWSEPDRLLATGAPLQDKERCLVVRLTDGNVPLVLKRQNWGGAWKTFCKSLRTPQARQSFVDGIYLVEQSVRTPRPLALLEQRLGPFGIQSYLLTEHIAGTSLYRLMRFEQPSRELTAHLADQVAELCTQLDDLRVSHNDLKPENLLIDHDHRIWLIDLEKLRRHKTGEPARARLLEDLNRLLHPRSWRENRAAAELFCDRLRQTPAVTAALSASKSSRHPLVDQQLLDRGAEHRLTVIVADPGSHENLQACVESFRDFADEWLVIGKGAAEESSTATEEQANNALAAARHPWVLFIRGDERVSPDLAKEIPCLMAAGPKSGAYQIEVRRVLMGRAIRYGAWRGDAPVRLARRATARFVTTAGKVEMHCSETRPGRLNSKLMLHIDWQGAAFDRHFNEETSRLAQVRSDAGHRANLGKAMARAIGRFAHSYLLKFGFLDGRAGLQLSLYIALQDLSAELKLSALGDLPISPAVIGGPSVSPSRQSEVDGRAPTARAA